MLWTEKYVVERNCWRSKETKHPSLYCIRVQYWTSEYLHPENLIVYMKLDHTYANMSFLLFRRGWKRSLKQPMERCTRVPKSTSLSKWLKIWYCKIIYHILHIWSKKKMNIDWLWVYKTLICIVVWGNIRRKNKWILLILNRLKWQQTQFYNLMRMNIY